MGARAVGAVEAGGATGGTPEEGAPEEGTVALGGARAALAPSTAGVVSELVPAVGNPAESECFEAVTDVVGAPRVEGTVVAAAAAAPPTETVCAAPTGTGAPGSWADCAAGVVPNVTAGGACCCSVGLVGAESAPGASPCAPRCGPTAAVLGAACGGGAAPVIALAGGWPVVVAVTCPADAAGFGTAATPTAGWGAAPGPGALAGVGFPGACCPSGGSADFAGAVVGGKCSPADMMGACKGHASSPRSC